jgi:hypothetical protein
MYHITESELRYKAARDGSCTPLEDVRLVAMNTKPREMLVCAKVSARLLRTALPGLGYDGARDSTSPLHFIILITTRSRSVFRRIYNTKTSRRNHKRKLLSHMTITIAFRFEMCAMVGRSTHAGKAGVSLSASLPGGVTHAGRSVFWSDHAEKKGQFPLGLAPH